MSAWETVFDHQMILWNFFQSAEGAVFANGFKRAMQSTGSWGLELPGQGSDFDFAHYEVERLYRAEPIYVAPEMQDVIEIASQTFEPEPLLPSDLLTPSGFVVFPRPFYVTDRSDKEVAWRALLWHTLTLQFVEETTQGILISMYSHSDDPDDIPEPPSYYTPKLALFHLAPWTFGTEIPDEPKIKQPLRQIQSFFRLTMQHITTHGAHVPSRATRRRAQRMKMPEKNVTVIRLRRPKSKPHGESEPIAHDHRWLVRGHWRNQWFPSLKAHRQIYIHDYIKGPEDKPLRISERRAFELVQ
jgi:hypothetical protein